MAWEHLSINRPHLVYIILGGFTSIFMLCSLFIKEKLYIGEATVATICGIIFGPHAANLINPLEWGNPDLITLEFSRIVLVVQCFAVGVELPKSYMERHWRSVVYLLVPVMVWGWLITSLFIWWMIEPLTWLESLICAACVTATDPVLASSVVGKGKYAKRVPKHLRDILSAESGCNDGMAFPFIYLAVYIARYRPHTDKVALHWFCYTVLYECIFGAIYGFIIGYMARHAIKAAENKGLIDRESFLVFYFVLALFCAGSGSLLGLDDLLVGFSAGVGFSNDGWFTEKTEESHVSNVIDLLLNLTYFVYFGTVIPWDQFNAPEHGMIPWRLVVLGLLVLLFRRIPIMLALKPVLPDVKTWREALFAGHFGPIGVGAIFVAILARAELQTQSTEPLAVLLPPGTKDYEVMYLIWPITCFLVIISIAVHGSSIAVFTLGKRINTLTLTLSYTQDNDAGRSWMDRLPRLSASNSKSLSRLEAQSFDSTSNEKLPLPPGALGPDGLPSNFLRRQKDDTEKAGTAPIGRSRRRKKWEPGTGPGGPISQSAIQPQRRSETVLKTSPDSASDTLGEKSADVSSKSRQPSDVEKAGEYSSTSSERGADDNTKDMADVEAFEEGHHMIIEDEEGNVLSTSDTRGRSPEEKVRKIAEVRQKLSQEDSGEHTKHEHEAHTKTEGEEIEKAAAEAVSHPYKNLRKHLGHWRGWGKAKEDEAEGESSHAKSQPLERRRGPAHAYQFGNTIIVEDEDGEVIKTYTLPGREKHPKPAGEPQAEGWRKAAHTADMRRGLNRMGTWVGIGDKTHMSPAAAAAVSSAAAEGPEALATPGNGNVERDGQSSDLFSDDPLRFTISHIDHYGHGLSGTSGTSKAAGITTGSGRRYSTAAFLKELQQMDRKSQIKAINESNAPDHVKTEMKRVTTEEKDSNAATGRPRGNTIPFSTANRPGGAARSASEVVASSLGDRPGPRRVETDSIAVQSPSLRPTPDTSGAPPLLRPGPLATSTLEEKDENEDQDEQEEDIPTHDVTSALAKYKPQVSTAADDRRKRLATIDSDGLESPGVEGEDDGEEVETAAEKRRRLAALGVTDSKEREGSEGEGEDESDEEVGEGLRGTTAPRKPRVQWGGESGRETPISEVGTANGGGAGGEGSRDSRAAAGTGASRRRRGIKGLLGGKKG